MTAYYNEFDPKAAAWLRELIKAGLIAPGIVDERSIEDVTPNDLDGFTQCHFFAGIGGWSYALRRAGWPDDRRVWTMSCPCQPFSAAGKGDGFADERHLWPAGQYLISQRKPDIVFGEQVAGKDADTWIDLVHTDMEALGYAFGAIPFPSAGVGAPHIRDRLYWVADAQGNGHEWGWGFTESAGRTSATHGGTVGRLGESDSSGWIKRREGSEAARYGCAAESAGSAGRMGNNNNNNPRLEGLRRGHQAEGGRIGAVGSVAEAGEFGGVADTSNCSRQRSEPRATEWGLSQGVEEDAAIRPGPTNGFWRDADWLGCRDGKWRPVMPGTFPLAHGASARVGRLRGYGNAINAEAATAFIEAWLGI